MKTTIARIAAALSLSAALFASPLYASDDKPALSTAKIEPYGYGKKVRVAFQVAEGSGLASVRIKDANQEIVYQEFVKKGRVFKKVFDLSRLDQGTYTLEVFNGQTESQQTFVLDEIMHSQALRTIFIAGSDYKHFRIAMENLSNDDVELIVKDANGNILSEETLTGIYKKVIEKDFSYLKAGEYTVEVHGTQADFSKKLIIP